MWGWPWPEALAVGVVQEGGTKQVDDDDDDDLLTPTAAKCD